MCGIAGFIGKSNNPHVSFSLATKLFEGIESRGKDAAGFWGSRDNGDTICYKESITSSQIVKKDIWNKVRNFDPNILLLHARASSIGVGHASDNVNNHPFMSEDNRVAIIHNGFIPEYSLLEEKYETISKCDSEIILRMFDASASASASAAEDVISTRMNGLESFFSYVNYGQMAVAIGERVNESSYLWIFRNQHRPLWIIDLRKTLGQIFFCSTENIWKRAVDCCADVGWFTGGQRLFEVPTEELWIFKVSKERPVVDEEDFLKFKIEKSHKENILWNNNVEKIEIRKGEPIGEVFSEPTPDNLNETFQLFDGFKDHSSHEQNDYDINDKYESIKGSISNIKTIVEDLSYEFSESELINLLSSLEQIKWDVTGALKILKNS